MALTKVTGQVVNTSTDLTVGVLTATTVSVGGTLTYEDVTNVDSVGLITARNGIEVTDKGVQVGTGATVDSAADNVLTFLTNGSERVRIKSDGKVGIGTTSPSDNFTVAGSSGAVNLGITVNTANAYDSPSLKFLGGNLSTNSILFGDASDADIGKIVYNHDGNSLAFTVNASERLRIDSSGRLLVGSTSAVTNVLTFSPVVQVEGTTANTSRITAIRNAAAAGAYPSFIGAKSRGTSNGSYTIVQDDDKVGAVQFGGADGAKFVDACSIFGEVDGTPGLNDMPGRLVFNTTADGASSPTERMRIDSSGNVGINATSYDAKLHVSGAYNQTGLKVLGGGAGYSSPLIVGAASGTEYMRVDDDGRLLLGLTSSSASASAVFQGFAGSSAGQAILQLQVGKNNAATANNENLGSVRFGNSDGALGALISSEADAQWASSDYPGRLTFHTTADGASSTTERMRIDSSGLVQIGTTAGTGNLNVAGGGDAAIDIIADIDNNGSNQWPLINFRRNSATGTPAARIYQVESDGSLRFDNGGSERLRIQSGGGISFNGDTAADNALDDYEQGTWNPTVSFNGSTSGVTYNEQQGIYVKIGNLVWAQMVLSLTNNGTGSGVIAISLPFAVGDNSENRGVGNLAYFASFSGLNSIPNIYASTGGATTCRLQHLNNSSGSGTQVTTLTNSNVTNSASWRGAILYSTID